MLMANSTAIITDAFPADQRGTALGINIVAALAGQFIGLVLGGVLAAWDWRSVFWVNVPVGIIGTIWAYKSLHDNSVPPPRPDRLGGANVSFGIGLTALLAAIVYGHPALRRPQTWAGPTR